MLWLILLQLIERAPDDEALAFVAAGPLRSLVQAHPEAFEDRLVDQTRPDPRFRPAMQDVWGWERVPASVRDRVMRLL